MRKWGIIALLACVTALCLALVACGGSGNGSSDEGTAAPEENRIDFIWYSAVIPDGFTPDESSGDTCYDINFVNGDRSFTMGYRMTDPTTARDDMVDPDSGWVAGEDVTYGAYTWKTIDFTWMGEPGCAFYTEYAGNKTFYVTAYGIARDDPDMVAFLSSIQLSEEDLQDEAKNTPYTDVM
jgi:hypothetical protein